MFKNYMFKYMLLNYLYSGVYLAMFTRHSQELATIHGLPACLLKMSKVDDISDLRCGAICAKESRCKYFLYDLGTALCVVCIQTRDYTSLEEAYLSHSALISTHFIQIKMDVCQPLGVCVPHNCAEYREQGYHKSGEYLVLSPTSTSGETMTVYCDMVTDDGGWMVLQRRTDGSCNFYRDWSQYKSGFGNISHEFWMGNDYIAAFTQQANYELRIDLADFDGTYVYTTFGNFKLDPSDLYRLSYSTYSGNVGNSLESGNGQQFSTFDSDHDTSSQNCASTFKGAWWYDSCHRSNLNGQYLSGPVTSFADSVTWESFRGQYYSLKFTEMKIRPLDFIPPKDLNSFETDLPLPRDCADLRDRGVTQSGVYSIHIDHLQLSFDVYCDMETTGGGWLVFQRRQDGSEDFYQGWDKYVTGFGNLNAEFWLGNDNIASVTEHGSYELRVDMSDFDSNHKYALYKAFSVNRNLNYQLRVEFYEGDAGDSLTYSNAQQWSTYDSDNDQWHDNCAVTFQGAWWYKDCHRSNLNGLYKGGSHTEFAVGVNWHAWQGHYYSLKWTEMKIRPTGYNAP